MTEMTVEELPVLFSRSSKGAVLEWKISVVQRGREGTPAIRVEFGHMTGEKQIQYKDITSGKNIGKKNETTPLRQAILEASSVWNKKRDKGYMEEIPAEGHCNFLPMLAHNFSERAHDIRYPCHVQPKLEGVRCLAMKTAVDEMRYLSRNGIAFPNLKFLDKFYLPILAVGEVVDGEIYNPGMPFEQIISTLKNPKFKGEGLGHFVYDFPSHKGGFEDRIVELNKRIDLIDEADCPIEIVDTDFCYNERDVMSWHDHYVGRGYEGIIIRNMTGEYKYDHRSADLQKYKEFIDEEFEILAIEPGTGRDKDIGNFICKCHRTGLLFGAPSTGDRRLRSSYLMNPGRLIGERVTVRYQRLTEKGVPYLPKAIAVRDYE